MAIHFVPTSDYLSIASTVELVVEQTSQCREYPHYFVRRSTWYYL